MKTSELKKIVEENSYEFQKAEDFIYIHYLGYKIMTLDLQNQAITLGNNVLLGTPRIKKVMVALIEYSLTPISEREDEKKYYIHQPICNQFLNFVTLDKRYIMSDSKNVEGFQTQFTQQEINNFPAEIKGTIECGFLKMFEVKE